MTEINQLLQSSFAGNTIQQYALFLLILLAGYFSKHFISRISNRIFYILVKKQAKGVTLAGFQSLLHKPVSFTLMMVVLYVAFSQLDFPAEWEIRPRDEGGWNMVLFRGFSILLYSGFIWVALRATDVFKLVLLERASKSENKFSIQLIPFFMDGIKVAVAIIGLLVIMGSVFHLNVATLVGGLGIGALAVALAAKESLENLLGSFTIFLDKPFVVGDLVTVGETTGVVENVGFRSTRLRTLDKSYVTLPNKKMVDSELENLTLRTSRRANFSIGLTYQTTIEQMKAIVRDIQEYVDNHPLTNQDGRVRFKEFGDSSLEIMVVYFVDTMDWTTFLDVREEINYRIMEIVKEHQASFAFPSTSVYLEKMDTDRGAESR